MYNACSSIHERQLAGCAFSKTIHLDNGLNRACTPLAVDPALVINQTIRHHMRPELPGHGSSEEASVSWSGERR
jgi:hypothetical protein